MIGKTILHYKILEKLGEGGMGVVHKAEDSKLKREVAIKFLPHHIAASEEERERFKIEAQAAAALNHPNIATIYAIEEVDDQMFIVMEYIEGQELREIVGARGPVPLPDVVDYATQIASGLQAAHEKDVTHRDIKSANIMVTEKGQIKIMDFGLAKVRGGARFTKVGTTLGTTAYMSPEQTQGAKTDQRTDIWAFGVLLYEMLTGQMPFPGDYEQAVIYSILNEEPKPISELRSETPEPLQNIVQKALAKEPQERYQTTANLLTDLSNLSNQETGTPLKYPKRSRAFVLMAAGFLLMAVIAVIFFLKDIEFTGTSNHKEALVEPPRNQWQKSIAVLPFSDLSQAKDQEYFCDGMTEQIITNLSRLQDLKVIARTSVMTFKGSSKTISEIGKALSVSHVLEGSIRKAGDRIRVTAQLIKVDDGTNLWGNEYDREVQDIFGVQDDVSQAIATALFEQLSPKDVQAVRTQQTENVAAYEYNLKGKYFHQQKFIYYFRVEDFKKSEEMFEKAIELDPNYALAYAGLADLYDSFVRLIREDKKYDDLRHEYAEKAFQLDPHSEYVNTARGWTKWGRREYDSAYESMKRALELNANDWFANLSMAMLLDHFGLEYQAVSYIAKAIRLNPLFAGNYYVRGTAYNVTGDFGKAELDYRRGMEIDPEHMQSLNGMTEQLILMNQLDEADSLLARCKAINPDLSRNNISAAWLYAAKGEREKALSTHEDDIVYILLGMQDQAIRQLNMQHKNGWPLGITGPRHGNYLSLKSLAIYDSLRDDPRFIEILKKEKQRYEELVQKYGELQSQPGMQSKN